MTAIIERAPAGTPLILVVTNRDDHTADYLLLELQRRGTRYFRLNTEDLPQHVAIEVHATRTASLGAIHSRSASVPLEHITSVWYRRPALPIPARTITDHAAIEFAAAESQAAIDGLLSILDVFWVSHPHLIRRAEHKLLQLHTARRLGFSVPDTIVTNRPETAERFLEAHDVVVYKPLRRGRIVSADGTQLIFTNIISKDSRSSLDSVALAPSLLQEYIPKQFEVRVTIIGTHCFAVAIHSQESEETSTDWRRGDPNTLRHDIHNLPEAIQRRCTQLVGEFGLAFGAIDLIVTPDGDHVFLEINPNGQWAWLQQLCPELPLRETLADLLSDQPAHHTP